MNFYILVLIMLSLMLFVIISTEIAYSQKVVNSQSYHIQNNSVIVIPSLSSDALINFKGKNYNYTDRPSYFKSPPLNSTVSYSNVNATITVSEKIVNGTDILGINKTFIIPNEKILKANISFLQKNLKLSYL